MSEEQSIYVSMKVREIGIPQVPSVKLMCTGGCGEEVWVDKRLERLWSTVPVLCLECALGIMDVNRDTFSVAPETIESLMAFMIANRDQKPGKGK